MLQESNLILKSVIRVPLCTQPHSVLSRSTVAFTGVGLGPTSQGQKAVLSHDLLQVLSKTSI